MKKYYTIKNISVTDFLSVKRIFLKRGTIGGARLQEIRQIPVNFRASSSHYTT